MRYQIHANQGDREFTYLANVRERVLIEYLMPNGSSAMKIIPKADYELFLNSGKTLYAYKYKGLTYGCIPQYWVNAMVAEFNENDLEFTPQQTPRHKIQEFWDKFQRQVEKARLNA